MATTLSLEELKEKGEANSWLTPEGFSNMKSMLWKEETPKGLYRRLANTAAKYNNEAGLEEKIFSYLWNGWLCPATPVASNFGLERGLPISCFSLVVGDSVDEIFKSSHELAMMSKNGGGVAFGFSGVRARKSTINGGGESEGIVPWMKLMDVTTHIVSQGNVRRGAGAGYLHINHGDIEEFLRIRRPTGDVNRQCLNTNHGVVIDDAFMQRVEAKEEKAIALWKEILKTRFETGEPYIMWEDNINKVNPPCYVGNGLKVQASNICTEITLFSDVMHSFVCCLSSLNLSRWEEWKDTDLVETAIKFLDAVMSEFINKAGTMPGLEKAVRFATKSRALGLGVLGWHTLLQEKALPFDSFESQRLNVRIFKLIKEKSEAASRELAAKFGEPEWCQGYGIRNTHLIAVAPTVTNSTISGNVSAGIEPIAANAFAKKGSKGTFMQQNPTLKKLLASRGLDNDEIWKSIINNEGSVQHLTSLEAPEKEVYLTAREINQMAIINQAGARQKYIDQAQSINLFFPADVDARWFNKIHMEAWKQGIKTLYYCRTGSVLKGDVASRFYDSTCKSCEG